MRVVKGVSRQTTTCEASKQVKRLHRRRTGWDEKKHFVF